LWIHSDAAFAGYLNILSEAGEGWEGEQNTPSEGCGVEDGWSQAPALYQRATNVRVHNRTASIKHAALEEDQQAQCIVL
jgi:hypothetical protein